MNFPDDVPRWRRYLRFWRPNVQRDVDDELRFHFEMRIDELTAHGMANADARRQAIIEFGDVRQTRTGLTEIGIRAASRRARSERLREMIGELGYAVRSLQRSPGVALAILATLALGVGANAAMFTLLNTLFLRAPVGVVAPAGVRRVWAERNYADGCMNSASARRWAHKYTIS
jgi:putative ABC transport system permease protein